LTPRQFSRRYFPPELQPVAERLRESLDISMGFPISGLTPADDFLALLRLDGPARMDSTEEDFFEGVAAEFALKFRDRNPGDFRSFDELVRYVGEQSARR